MVSAPVLRTLVASPPGLSSPGALHRHSVGALTSRAAFPVRASAFAIAWLQERNVAVATPECLHRSGALACASKEQSSEPSVERGTRGGKLGSGRCGSNHQRRVECS